MGKYTDLINQLPLERGEWVGTEYHGLCPFHAENRPSFYINGDSGLWFCHSGCGGGAVWAYVKRQGNLSDTATDRMLEDYEHGAALQPVSMDSLVAALRPAVAAEPYQRAARLRTDLMPSWFVARGFSEWHWQTWDLAFDPATGDVCIPLCDAQGQPVGEIHRRPPGAQPKYLYSPGFPRREYVWGAHRVPIGAPTVYVTEGSLDAIWMSPLAPAVATLGSHFSEPQVGALAWFSPQQVVLAFDNDPAGAEATRKATQALLPRFGPRLFVQTWPEGVKDPQELNYGQLYGWLSRRPPVTALGLNLQRALEG